MLTTELSSPGRHTRDYMVQAGPLDSRTAPKSSGRADRQGEPNNNRPTGQAASQARGRAVTAPLPKPDSGKHQTSTVQPAVERGSLWPPTAEWALVIVTVALVGMTFCLARYTLRLWAATRKLAKDARTAATTQAMLTREALELSRKQFVNAFPPRVHVRHMERVDPSSWTDISYRITNDGQSPAIIVHCEMASHVLQPGQALPKQPFAKAYDVGIGHLDLAPGEVVEMTWHSDFRPVDLIASDVLTNVRVLVAGFVDYNDTVGVKRRTGFCRIYEPTSQRLRPFGDPEYEYPDG